MARGIKQGSVFLEIEHEVFRGDKVSLDWTVGWSEMKETEKLLWIDRYGEVGKKVVDSVAKPHAEGDVKIFNAFLNCVNRVKSCNEV